MKYLIGNTVINADHIVFVEYDPERDGIDDESGEPFHKSSRVTITLSAIERDVEEGYEGAIYGVGSKSKAYTWHGPVADAFWAAYSKDAYTVVA